MAKNPLKRKASEQLTPYNETNIFDDSKGNKSQDNPTSNISTSNKKSIDHESLKGIFSNINTDEKHIEKHIPHDSNDPIAGLNESFYKSISKVISKQKNKDLRFLLKQYIVYIEDLTSNKPNSKI